MLPNINLSQSLYLHNFKLLFERPRVLLIQNLLFPKVVIELAALMGICGHSRKI